MSRPPRHASPSARDRILQAAVQRVRAQGYTATRVDQLCEDARVTKGAFFHHFASKDELGVALAEHWTQHACSRFTQADYHRVDDPVARVLAYVDLRIAMIQGPTENFSCVAGTMIQEAFATHEDLRRACADSILGHARSLEDDLAAALKACGITDVDAASLARHTQTVIQGAFVLAKTSQPDQAADMAREALGHLRRYLELLFQVPRPSGASTQATSPKGRRSSKEIRP